MSYKIGRIMKKQADTTETWEYLKLTKVNKKITEVYARMQYRIAKWFQLSKKVINRDRSNQIIVEKLPLKHWKFHEISNTSVSYTK